MNKRVAVLIGESASGKSAVKKAILKLRPDYNEVITTTTRPIREGEVDGVDYHFCTDQQMVDKIYEGVMLEVVSFRDWFYGTDNSSVKEDVINIGVWNPEGMESLNDEANLDCLNIYIYAPPKVRLLRSLLREEDPDVDEIVRRYGTDKKDFREIDVPNLITIENDGSRPIEEVAAEVISKIDRYLGKF